MKILIVTQYFWPETFKINDLAIGLKAAGHEVTVLTGLPNYPKGSYYSGYHFLSLKKESYQGITVRRVPIISRGKNSPIRLLLNYLSFVFFGVLFGPFYCRGKFDNIFVFEPSPITVGIPAILLKKIKKTKLFFWVQDLWPESLIATGTTESSLILKSVEKLTGWIYKHCDKILIQCKGFETSITNKNISSKDIAYFPNWAENFYQPQPPQLAEIKLLEFPEGFIALFAGNLGKAQSLETIIKAANLLKEKKDIHFVFLGDGRQKTWLEDQAKKLQLSNIHILGYQSAETMPYYFAMAQIMLVSLRKNPAFEITVPSKIQTYLACAKPIVGSLDGFGAQIIHEAKAGFCGPAEDAECLAENILKCYKMPKEDLSWYGEQGKAYSDECFNRDKLITELIQLMRESRNE